jgi:RNA polymerase sigma factor (sigma-70 family)
VSRTGLNKVVEQLKQGSDPAAGASDRDLLTRFLEGQDETAFEALVRRHERLVRSAIGKVLADAEDAEDAFQATFLVLVRRAKQLDDRAGMGTWLYGVAHRIAVKARAAGRARKQQEARATPAGPTAPTDLSWREACDLLHAELDRLPESYRTPLLLCYLEGKTRDEVATALGVTVAAVRGRLERGREMLRDRLSRRGVTLSVGLLTAVAAPQAAGSGSAAAFAAVLEAVCGAASARAIALSRETITLTILAKATLAAAFTIGLVAAAVAATASRNDAPRPDDKLPAAKVGPAGNVVNPIGIPGNPSAVQVMVLAPD